MADLTVMTWNIQNLFPVGSADGPANQQNYDDKIGALAAVIDAIEPDVRALQEVGPEEVLDDLLGACSIDFDNRLAGVPDTRGIRVALLSPRRLSNRTDILTYPSGVLPVQHRDVVLDDPGTAENESQSSDVSRGVLSATIPLGRPEVTVMVAHLKSKLITYGRQPGVVGGSLFAPNDEGERLRYSGYALYRRTAEAMSCRAALDTVLTADGDAPRDGPGTGKTNPVIFCGDLNDEPLAASRRLRDRLPPGLGLPQRRSGRWLPNVEPVPPAAPRGSQLHPHLPIHRATQPREDGQVPRHATFAPVLDRHISLGRVKGPHAARHRTRIFGHRVDAAGCGSNGTLEMA